MPIRVTDNISLVLMAAPHNVLSGGAGVVHLHLKGTEVADK